MSTTELRENLSALTVAEGRETPAIVNLKEVTSYNWLNTEDPSVQEDPKIAVPGMPAKWLNRKDTPMLKPDTETRWIDQNNGRCPGSPFEPGIRAVLHQEPDYDFSSIDLIADRYNLASLLEFTLGSENDFEFGAQVIGNSILLVSTEAPTPQSILKPRGFRQDFGQKYLQYDACVEESLKHYRVITYQLGGMKIMLQYAVDGYLTEFAGDIDAHVAMGESSLVDERRIGDLIIESAGTLVPHEAIIELNTCQKYGKSANRIESKLRDAWLSQNHHFVVASDIIPRGSKDWRKREGFVKQSDILFRDKDEILNDSGMADQTLVAGFVQKLKKLLEDIRCAAVENEGDKFLVKREEAAEDVTITPCEKIRGFSEELWDRLKYLLNW